MAERLELRPYQARALDAVAQQHQSGHRSVCLVLPTGSGKTFVGARHVAERRCLWVAHRRELVSQAAVALRRELGYGAVGAIAPGLERVPEAAVQVASIQTLLAREGVRPPADVLVLDEAHHYLADQFRTILASYPEARVLGLTATPERGDGKPLGDVFGSLVVGAHYSELLADGHLVPCRVYQPPAAMGSRELAQDPLAAYRRYVDGQRAFVFVSSVQIAREQAKAFCEAGVPAGVISYETAASDRVLTLRRFADGDLRALVNVYALTEGVDVPAASACILARGCDHAGMYLQIAGRILRPAPGKAEATLVDLTGASLRHGLPTLDRAYSLEGEGIRQAAGAALRNCLRCGACYPSQPGPCPECGYLEPVRTPPPPKIYSLELREVFAGQDTPSDAKAREYMRLRAIQQERGFKLYWVQREYKKLFGEAPVITDASREERDEELARLVAFAASRGYKQGFAAVRYREMFGAWPPRR